MFIKQAETKKMLKKRRNTIKNKIKRKKEKQAEI